jgi:predicted ATP-binding protein involved in virulence
MNQIARNESQLGNPDCIGDVRIHGEDVSLNTLSDGYSSMIAFVGHFVRAALRHGMWTQNPLLATGILLVDELDAHLHPVWQTRVYGDLRRVFPNLQIISSTHSP